LEREQLAAIIRKKEARLGVYRAAIAGAPIWLLIACGISVARGVAVYSCR
jgi:hypothetical protein